MISFQLLSHVNVFYCAGRHPGNEICCWVSRRSDAGNGILNILSFVKGDDTNNLEYIGQ